MRTTTNVALAAAAAVAVLIVARLRRRRRLSSKPDDHATLCVAARFTVTATQDKLPLLELLRVALPAEFPSLKAAKHAVRRRLIVVDGAAAAVADAAVAGQTVEYVIRPREHLAARDATPLPDLALEWAHVDDWVAVLVKPAGVAVQGDVTDEGKRRSAALRRAVAAALPPPAERPDALSHPQFVHRLDKGTGGLLVYARTQAACARLATAFATPGAVRKTYVALVAGRLDGDGVVDEPVSGRPARSRWRALGHTPSAASGWVTTLELKPEHGRRHQLRKHCARALHSGTARCHILGDVAYGGAAAREADDEHLYLWAKAIEMPHPHTGATLALEIDEPPHFSARRQREAATMAAAAATAAAPAPAAAMVGDASSIEEGSVRVALVPREDAERTRRALDAAGLLSPAHRAFGHDGAVALPLIDDCMLPVAFSELRVQRVDAAAAGGERGVHARLRERAHAALLAAGVSEDAARAALEHGLPRRWEKLGDVVLLAPQGVCAPGASALAAMPREARAALWASIAAAVGARRLGVQGAVEPSLHRKSGARLLWPEEGADGWVAHRENGIVYGLDVTRNMFSSGNGTEKARVAARNCDGEVVVDLYAGIGYFTLPYLVHARAAHVHACEWDADALAALRHNLHANGVAARCTVHAGDNARSAPAFAGTADRVNLGLIPSSEAGWPTAVAALRARGGWLHVHANVGDGEEARWSAALLDALRALAAAAGREWRLDVEHVERVKWYAPRIRHVVADVRVVAAPGAAAPCAAAADVREL